MRKILFICQGYAPYYGGAENALTATAEEAAKDTSLEVHVLTSDIGGRLSPLEKLNGVNVHRVSAAKKDWSCHTVKELLSFYFAASKQIDNLQKNIAPDFIFAHFTMPAGLVARRWFLKYAVPYSVVLHGSDVPGYQPDRFKLIHIPMQIAARMVWAKAKAVVAVGKPLKELAHKTWKGNIQVIPNGVNLETFYPLKNKIITDQTSPVKFAVTAQLIYRKGIQYIIESLTLLNEQQRNELEINIYGTGPYRAELEKMVLSAGVENIIFFRGLIDKDDMCKTLQGNDMFLMSSLQEGLPLSLLEAMACGLPAIVTRVGDIESVFTDKEDGILIDPGSALEIKDALVNVLNNRTQINAMRESVIKKSKSFSWDIIWNQYKEIM
jgi:glycosyltransferase involved in cell wall biosynthesis